MKNNEKPQGKTVFSCLKKVKKTLKNHKRYLFSFGVIFVLALITSLFVSGVWKINKSNLYSLKNYSKNNYQKIKVSFYDKFISNSLLVEFDKNWDKAIPAEDFFTKERVDEINKQIICEETKEKSCYRDGNKVYENGVLKDPGKMICHDIKRTFCHNEFEVYQAGRVISGKYRNFKIYYLLVKDLNFGITDSLYRFLKNDREIILLPQYSDDISEAYENIFGFKKYYLRDEDVSIPALDAPEKIRYGSHFFSLERANLKRREYFKVSPERLKIINGNLIEIENDKYYLLNYAMSQHLYRMMIDETLERYDFNFDFFVKTNDNGNGHFYGKTAEYRYTLEDSSYSVDVKSLEVCENLDLSYNLLCLKNDGKTDYSKIFWKTPYGSYIKFDLISDKDDFGNKKKVEMVDPHNMLWGKPVIYLYPTKTTDISVKVEPVGGLTISDPEYKHGWFVRANPEGEIFNYADGKKYPYLFWEGNTPQYDIENRGTVVKKEDVRDFLVNSLQKQGLIKKEYDEFIDFWLPRMQASEYYQIYFIPQSEIDKMAPLEISPKPDSVVRILMDYRPLDNYIDTTGQSFSKPPRNGFTVVEWGGILK